MTATALRYYKNTFAYTSRERERKLREMRIRFRTSISRRRVKQGLREAIHRLHLS